MDGLFELQARGPQPVVGLAEHLRVEGLGQLVGGDPLDSDSSIPEEGVCGYLQRHQSVIADHGATSLRVDKAGPIAGDRTTRSATASSNGEKESPQQH